MLLDHLHLIHPSIRHGHPAVLAIDLHHRGWLHQLVNPVIQFIDVVQVRVVRIFLETRGDRIFLLVDLDRIFL